MDMLAIYMRIKYIHTYTHKAAYLHVYNGNIFSCLFCKQTGKAKSVAKFICNLGKWRQRALVELGQRQDTEIL